MAEEVTPLEWALKARIPLVITTTEDPAHFQDVIQHIFPNRVVRRLSSRDIPGGDESNFEAGSSQKMNLVEGGIYWRLLAPPWTENRSKADEWAYRTFAACGATVVVVNPHRNASIGPMWFDGGPVPVPANMIFQLLCNFGLSSEAIKDIEPALGGLTIKEVSWLVAVTQAKYHAIDRKSIAEMRRSSFPDRQGLSPVDTEVSFYTPDAVLEEWLSVEAKFLLHEDERLRPRGVLLTGKPGTGKSMFSKHLAGELGVPLFRLETAGIKDKYVGQSERAMRHMLMTVDREAPCVLLIDEVEKLFSVGHSDNTGVNQGLLASLLWWLQEHKSSVITVMTTNNEKIIPPELFRPGRIDLVAELPGVPVEKVPDFAEQALKSYNAAHLLDTVVKDLAVASNVVHVSQAYIVEVVRRAVKKHIAQEMK